MSSKVSGTWVRAKGGETYTWELPVGPHKCCSLVWKTGFLFSMPWFCWMRKHPRVYWSCNLTPESLNPAVFCMSHFHSSLFLLSFLSLHSPVTLQPIVLIIRTQTRHHYCYQWPTTDINTCCIYLSHLRCCHTECDSEVYLCTYFPTPIYWLDL